MTFAEKMLQKIEALLEGKADSDVQAYSIAGRSLSRFSFGELQALRASYLREIAAHKKDKPLQTIFS